MYQKSKLLLSLFDDYGIVGLSHGAREDKIGDVFENYCVQLLSNNDFLIIAKQNNLNISNIDDYVYFLLINHFPYCTQISKISATNRIEHRYTGGNSKTDVIADITYQNGTVISFPISVKQSTAAKVAMAEFDVATIVREIGITDSRLIELMEKHQRDASAKNFSIDEKEELTTRLRPYKTKFVKWVVSGSPVDSYDLRFPKILIKFALSKPFSEEALEEIETINCYTIDEYVQNILYNSNGFPIKGGFETGLSWTYATGSKGYKIQFKG